jgi:hypothetical protein
MNLPEILVRLVVILFLLGGLSSAADQAELRQALDAHRWLDLRDAVASGTASGFIDSWSRRLFTTNAVPKGN